MDKQKINLDQLYQERFQSFEMEPSSDSSVLMMNKLKKARAMRKIKWIVAGVLTAAAIAIITFLSINSNEITTLNNTPSNENIIIENSQVQTENTKTKSQITKETKETQITKINETESARQIDENNHDQSEFNSETSSSFSMVQEQNKDDLEDIQHKNSTISSIEPNSEAVNTSVEANQETNQVSSEGSIAKSVTIDKIPIGDKEHTTSDQNEQINPDSSGSLNAINEANGNESSIDKSSNDLEFLQSKKAKLPSVSEEVNIEKTSLKQKRRSGLGASKAKFVSSNSKSGTLREKEGGGKMDGYFDLHFSPVLWNNQANWDQPVLDTSWTYSLQNKPQLSYEFGFAFQLHHQDLPLFMQIGLDYQILREKIDYNFTRTFEDPNLSYWDYDSLWNIEDVLDTFYIIVDSNHFVIDSIYTQDTLLSGVDSSYNAVVSKEEKNKSNVNTYRYLNIPLLLGYEFSSANNKWKFQIMGGAAIAINLKNEGYYYTRSGDFASYSGKVNPSIVWNLYAAANVNYRWKKWQLFAQPEFQYQLNESELSDGIPRRKYQFYKLKFGIRYQLF